MARLSIDRIAEQQKLHDRHHQDHGIGYAVPRELFELFGEHGKNTEETLSSEAMAYRGHWKLSFEPSISRMNTSSSVGSTSLQISGGWR